MQEHIIYLDAHESVAVVRDEKNMRSLPPPTLVRGTVDRVAGGHRETEKKGSKNRAGTGFQRILDSSLLPLLLATTC